uniref:(northern house mosquito) hypothetical protein n=1 Tax=Culex pipiens TaxID=7175 RepID=A0A8D8CRU1_CULPI
MDKDRAKLDRALAANHNLRLAQQLKTVQPGQTLTEAQKQAFQALMRMAHDPNSFRWNKRVEQMKAKKEKEWAQNRQNQAEQAATRRVEVPGKSNLEEPKRPRLRDQIREARRKGAFPLRPQIPSDRARRYGFIPTSQRETDLKAYAKV